MRDLLKNSSISEYVPHLIPHISRLTYQDQTMAAADLRGSSILCKNRTNFDFLTHNVIPISNWVPSNLHQPSAIAGLALPGSFRLPVGRLFAYRGVAFHIYDTPDE